MTPHPAYLQSQQCPQCRRVTRPGLSPPDPVLCSPACAELERRRLGLPPHGPFAIVEFSSTFRRYDPPAETDLEPDCPRCGRAVEFPHECSCQDELPRGPVQERETVARGRKERTGWIARLRKWARGG